MTDLIQEAPPDKRKRLIASASELLHRQGAARTTLAEVAEAADVPPGNVYYYFKTKDELVEAVVGSWEASFRESLAGMERRRSPAARLKALARSWTDMRDLVARYGCPIGTLASELDKAENGLDGEVAAIFVLLLDWSERQFRQIAPAEARQLAVSFLARIQGAALLSNALRDPKLLAEEVRRIERWIDSLA